MLSKHEIKMRIERDEEIYKRLSEERRTVYQRLRRYRNMQQHMAAMEVELAEFEQENYGDA